MSECTINIKEYMFAFNYGTLLVQIPGLSLIFSISVLCKKKLELSSHNTLLSTTENRSARLTPKAE